MEVVSLVNGPSIWCMSSYGGLILDNQAFKDGRVDPKEVRQFFTQAALKIPEARLSNPHPICFRHGKLLYTSAVYGTLAACKGVAHITLLPTDDGDIPVSPIVAHFEVIGGICR